MSDFEYRFTAIMVETHRDVGRVAADREGKHEEREPRTLGLAVQRKLRQTRADCRTGKA